MEKIISNYTGTTSKYIQAKRAIPVTDFPTVGFYFIKTVAQREDLHGNRFPVATVEWKHLESDEWSDVSELKHLRLDYLSGESCDGQKIDYLELAHRIIFVSDAFVSYQILDKELSKKVVVTWDIIGLDLQSDSIHEPAHNLPIADRLLFVANELLSQSANFNELFGHLDEGEFDNEFYEPEGSEFADNAY